MQHISSIKNLVTDSLHVEMVLKYCFKSNKCVILKYGKLVRKGYDVEACSTYTYIMMCIIYKVMANIIIVSESDIFHIHDFATLTLVV